MDDAMAEGAISAALPFIKKEGVAVLRAAYATRHVAPGGESVTQDCSACHDLLAVEEASPKVLSDVGLGTAAR
jgi:hypothetical protein